MPKNTSIDLHVHSTFSDGRLTPMELAERAARNGITALAITDHDSLAGMEEKEEACRRHGLECVIGVELSCHLDNREAHILALHADPAAPSAGRIGLLSTSRFGRMEAMLDKLADMGIRMEMAELPVGENGVYGRPHLARAMVERGVVKSVNEAFARYLYDTGPVHIAKTRLEAGEGIALAKAMGGVAVLAHPGVSGWLNELDRFVELGLDGIEVYHPKHKGEAIATLLRYCRDRSLVVSGGSDFHGPGDGPDIGAARVPTDVLEPLAALAGKRKGR